MVPNKPASEIGDVVPGFLSIQATPGVSHVTWDGVGIPPTRPDSPMVIWAMPDAVAAPLDMQPQDLRYEPASFPDVPVTVPSAPSSLTASSNDDRSSLLSWSSAILGEGVTKWYIYQDGVKLSIEPTVNSQVIAGLTNLQQYDWEVSAVNSVGESPRSPLATSTPADLVNPNPPTGVGAIAGNAQATLNFTNSTSPDVIDHEYDINASGTWISAGLDGTQLITPLTNDVQVSIRMRSKDDDGRYSAPTTAVTVTPSSGADSTLPSVPANLAITAVGDQQFTVNWDDATDNVALHATQPYDYQVGLADPPTGTPVPRGTSDAVITGLTNDVLNYVRVRSRDSSGNVSAWTTAVSDTPTAPPTWDPASIGLYADFNADTLDLTLNDNDPVTVWVDDAGSQDLAVSGGSPTFLAALAAANGKPVVYFDGNDHMFNDWVTSLAQPYGLLVIGRTTLANQVLTDGATSAARCNLKTTATGKYAFTAASTNLQTSANADANYHCFLVNASGGTSKLIVDGTETTGTNPGTAPSSGLRVGSLYDGSTNFLIGGIARIAFKPALWTAQDILDILAWSRAKYNTP